MQTSININYRYPKLLEDIRVTYSDYSFWNSMRVFINMYYIVGSKSLGRENKSEYFGITVCHRANAQIVAVATKNTIFVYDRGLIGRLSIKVNANVINISII